jgi:hypothetical protein
MDADMDREPRRLVPVPEARRTLGDIGHTMVYDLVNRGEIVKVNIGRRSFITSQSLDAYLDRLSAASRSSSASCGDTLRDGGVFVEAEMPDPTSASGSKDSGAAGQMTV